MRPSGVTRAGYLAPKRADRRGTSRSSAQPASGSAIAPWRDLPRSPTMPRDITAAPESRSTLPTACTEPSSSPEQYHPDYRHRVTPRHHVPESDGRMRRRGPYLNVVESVLSSRTYDQTRGIPMDTIAPGSSVKGHRRVDGIGALTKRAGTLSGSSARPSTPRSWRHGVASRPRFSARPSESSQTTSRMVSQAIPPMARFVTGRPCGCSK